MEHVGQHDHALACINRFHCRDHIVAARLDIVVWRNGDDGNLPLRADDMLQRGPEFRRQMAMGDKDETDHTHKDHGEAGALRNRPQGGGL
jgi:hypothetical protein